MRKGAYILNFVVLVTFLLLTTGSASAQTYTCGTGIITEPDDTDVDCTNKIVMTYQNGDTFCLTGSPCPQSLTESCNINQQCAGYSTGDQICSNGQCLLVNGEACGSLDSLCASGICGPAGTCQSGGLFDSCDDSNDCNKAVNNLQCYSGECKYGNGASCSGTIQCGGTLECVSGTCQEPPSGTTYCGSNADCPAGEQCGEIDPSGIGMCVTPVGQGEYCYYNDDDWCQTNLHCVGCNGGNCWGTCEATDKTYYCGGPSDNHLFWTDGVNPPTLVEDCAARSPPEFCVDPDNDPAFGTADATCESDVDATTCYQNQVVSLYDNTDVIDDCNQYVDGDGDQTHVCLRKNAIEASCEFDLGSWQACQFQPGTQPYPPGNFFLGYSPVSYNIGSSVTYRTNSLNYGAATYDYALRTDGSTTDSANSEEIILGNVASYNGTLYLFFDLNNLDDNFQLTTMPVGAGYLTTLRVHQLSLSVYDGVNVISQKSNEPYEVYEVLGPWDDSGAGLPPTLGEKVGWIMNVQGDYRYNSPPDWLAGPIDNEKVTDWTWQQERFYGFAIVPPPSLRDGGINQSSIVATMDNSLLDVQPRLEIHAYDPTITGSGLFGCYAPHEIKNLPDSNLAVGCYGGSSCADIGGACKYGYYGNPNPATQPITNEQHISLDGKWECVIDTWNSQSGSYENARWRERDGDPSQLACSIVTPGNIWDASLNDPERLCCGDDDYEWYVDGAANPSQALGGIDGCIDQRSQCIDASGRIVDGVLPGATPDPDAKSDVLDNALYNHQVCLIDSSTNRANWVDAHQNQAACLAAGGSFGYVGEKGGLSMYRRSDIDAISAGVLTNVYTDLNFGDTRCFIPGVDDNDYAYIERQDCRDAQYDPVSMTWTCSNYGVNIADAAICDNANDCVLNGVCYSDVKEAAASNYFRLNTVEDGTLQTANEPLEANNLYDAYFSEAHKSNLSAGIALFPFGATTQRSEDAYCDPGAFFPDADKGVVQGTIRNSTGEVQIGVEVRIAGNLTISDTTDVNGQYVLLGVPAGLRDVIVVGSSVSGGFSNEQIPNVEVPGFGGTVVVDAVITRAAGNCNADCTDQSGLCNAACDGLGLCSFPSPQVAATCDGNAPGLVDAGGAQVLCCTGTEFTPQKATVEVCGGSVVTTKRPVFYQGRLLNMVITVFDSTQCEE